MPFDKIVFQFLLVRLKDLRIRAYSFSVHISIPSGTIKSVVNGAQTYIMLQFQFLLVRLKVSTAPIALSMLLFQFLLVRLKEYTLSPFRFRKDISIPSGTIKRPDFNIDNLKTSKFQFLLVRLKEKNSIHR